MAFIDTNPEQGYYQLNSKRIVFCKTQKTRNDYSGSKSFKISVQNGQMSVFEIDRKEKKKIENDINNVYDDSMRFSFVLLTVLEVIVYDIDGEPIEVQKRSYKLKKNEVVNRCNAIFGLKIAKKNLSFMTASFPMGMNDDSIFRVWNTFLTRMRKAFGLRVYLWITERQKNGTLHYHMLVPQYIPIRVSNGYLAISIRNELEKNKQDSVKYDCGKYNGLDVKRCDSNLKALSAYLTKYISKGEIRFSHLAWHCSRLVSALFTAYNTPYFDEFGYIFNSRLKIERVYENDFAAVLYFDNFSIPKAIRLLSTPNELVYSYMTQPRRVVKMPENEVVAVCLELFPEI
jgi:hypothetical protein